MRVLVAVAHPDDECLMAGGTIAWHVSKGDEVLCSYVTDGVSSRPVVAGVSLGSQRRTRRLEFSRAMKELGATGDAEHEDYLDYDNALDCAGLLLLAKHWERVVTQFRPSIIYTHFAGDLNVDHRLVAQAVVTATRPGSEAGRSVHAIYAGETPSSTEWAFGVTGPPFTPQRFVSLAREPWVKKLDALGWYESEQRAAPHPCNVSSLVALAQWRGSQCGENIAEAFMVVREVVS